VTHSDYPRSLSKKERDALNLPLAADFPGVEELREQAKTVVVSGRCTCGCATIDLYVDPASAPPPATTSRIPVEAQTREDDRGETFGLLLFVDEGWLSLLEIVYYRDFIPAEFPAPSAFEPPTARLS
jgi:hypothetical protein